MKITHSCCYLGFEPELENIKYSKYPSLWYLKAAVINENDRPTKKEEKLEIHLFHQQIVLNNYCILSKTSGSENTRMNKKQHAVSSHRA